VHKTPLLSAHLAANATMADESGWLVPTSFGAVDAGVAAARAGAICLDLAWVEVLDLQAPELRRWANGMFTNNITRLPAGRGNRNAMCDDRGRLQGLLDLYCVSDTHFLAVLDGVDADWFEGRYRMFLILDDIEVDPRPDGATLLSVQGPAAGAALEAAGLPAPAIDRAFETTDAGVTVARRDRTGLGGYDLIVPGDQVVAVWAALQAGGATAAGTDVLDALRVVAGLAAWPQDGTDKTLVHELRLNADVCNFEKGCYVGQEVINRVDVRGAINKKLMGLRLTAPVPQGSPVMLDDKAVGTVTSLAELGGAVVGLGVLRKAAWAPGTAVEVATGDGAVAATVSDLPLSG
jgi:folate-binding protein YgfZ